MASTVQVPPPRPRRSLAGPAVLIILGIVFLMGTMGYLSWARLAHWFAYYWPVLLILWGVIKLVEYQRAQREGTRASGIGAGGVFLLIMLIGFGLAATQASRFNWGEIRDQIDIDDSDFTLFGHKYSYDDQLSQPFPPGASLHVTDTRGAVNVNASDDDQIHIVVRKRISADDQADADKWNSATKPFLTASGNVITLNANNQGAGDHGVAVDLDIALPRKAPVVISTRYGDVSVIGREADIQVTDPHGDVSATDITGKVSLNMDHGSVRVSQVSSDVSVDGRTNDLSIEDVKGSVHLSGEFMESVKLAKIAQSVSFRSSRTDLELARLDGDLDLDSGDLQASDILGPVRLSTRSKDVRLTGISGDARVQDENGTIELRINKFGSTQVENRSGDVTLYIPDHAGFQIDARGQNGEISSDFDSLKVNNADNEATAVGTANGGGPHIVVTNQHGTIELRKLSESGTEVPEPPKAPKAPKAPRAPSLPKVTDN